MTTVFASVAMDQRVSTNMAEGLSLPMSIAKPMTPHHNMFAGVDFGSCPTGRQDVPKPPPKDSKVYAVPGPGTHEVGRMTREAKHTLGKETFGKQTFGKETQRPETLTFTISPGPVYEIQSKINRVKHEAPTFSMSPRVWANASPRLKPYEPPLGKLPDSCGRQVEGDKPTSGRAVFPHSPQRPKVGAGGDKQFFGKELAYMSKGSASVHVPCYVTHKTGLERSAQKRNSPRFGFSKEERF